MQSRRDCIFSSRPSRIISSETFNRSTVAITTSSLARLLLRFRLRGDGEKNRSLSLFGSRRRCRGGKGRNRDLAHKFTAETHFHRQRNTMSCSFQRFFFHSRLFVVTSRRPFVALWLLFRCRMQNGSENEMTNSNRQHSNGAR